MTEMSKIWAHGRWMGHTGHTRQFFDRNRAHVCVCMYLISIIITASQSLALFYLNSDFIVLKFLLFYFHLSRSACVYIIHLHWFNLARARLSRFVWNVECTKLIIVYHKIRVFSIETYHTLLNFPPAWTYIYILQILSYTHIYIHIHVIILNELEKMH